MIMPADLILRMATINGAKSLLWDDEIGSIEENKKADIIIINPNTAGMLPLHDPIANLVTAMHSSNVESVLCDGVWVMKNRKITLIDEEAVLEEAKSRAKAIVKRAGIVRPDRFKTIR
jgi:5-methylthioadenosine/S-adenosylhomocysteine deaminase